MICSSIFEGRIEVRNRACMFKGIIGERLVKGRSTKIAFALRKGFDKLCNFSNAILRQLLDSVDKFLLFHRRIIARSLPETFPEEYTLCDPINVGSRRR
jgi:hypothetical protein